MKGKNLGKTIPARGHRGQQFREDIHLSQAKAEPTYALAGGNSRCLLPKTVLPGPDANSTNSIRTILPLDHFGGAELAPFVANGPVAPSTRYLFHELHRSISGKLYPQAFCGSPSEAETSWFESMIEIPCAFHCGLALVEARLARLRGHGDMPLQSTQHFAKAIGLLRCDLSTDSQPQDSSIAVAISLAVHANFTGASSEGRIHLEGLKQLVSIRPGGLASLCAGAPELGNKIRRADLELALLQGTSTIFGARPSAQPETPYLVPLRGRRSRIVLPPSLRKTCPTIQSTVRDIHVLGSYAGREQLGAFQYQDLVISLFQRLVDYAPLGGARPSCQLDDICQLGLLSFMCTVLYHSNQGRSAYSKLLSEIFWTRIVAFDSCTPTEKDLSLELWLTFVYALSAPDYKQFNDANSTVARRIRSLCTALALDTWEATEANLRVYPWISTFHSNPGKKLWESVNWTSKSSSNCC